MTIATSLRGAWSHILARVGNAAVIRDKTSDAYDPSTGTGSTETSDWSVQVANLEGVDPGLVDGETIMAGDVRTLMSAEGAGGREPEVNERLVIGSDTWRIVEVSPIRIQDTAVAWKLRLRK